MLARFASAMAALAFGFVLLAGLEGVLRGLGVGEELPRSDPFSGFSKEIPMFEPARRADGTAIFRLSRARVSNDKYEYEVEPQREFLADPAPNSFRIFVIGGSSSAGVPYPTNYAFSSWLEKRLEAALPEHSIEVVNAALSGYASRRLLPVVRELARYQPDLLIVYMGHNEWAERQYYAHLIDMDPRVFAAWEWVASLRMYRLLSSLLPSNLPGRSSAIPSVETNARQNSRQMFAVRRGRAAGQGYASTRDLEYRDLLYRFNLNEMTSAMQAVEAQVMFLTLSQNFSDWAPGASGHDEGVSERKLAEFQRLFDRAKQLEIADDCTAALAEYQRAREIDGEFAELHFRIAECQARLGDFYTARQHYRLASDLDRVPHGAPTQFNPLLQEVAQARNALFVDVDRLLQDSAENGLVGGQLFVDFVHPNVVAHQRIAAGIELALRAAGLPVPTDQWKLDQYRDPDPEDLYRAQPLLRQRELEVQLFSCQLALRDECVEDKIAALLRLDPENASALAARASLQRQRRPH